MHGRPAIRVFLLGSVYVAQLVRPRAPGDAGPGDLSPGDLSPDTIPTAFAADADPLAVLHAVARDNPHADVTLAPAPGATRTGC